MLPEIVMPEPSCFTEGNSYYNQRSICITPYYNRDWPEIIKNNGLKFPFKSIVTREMGKSKCSSCGAVYSGYQYTCNAHVRHVSMKERNGSYTKTIKSDTLCVGNEFRDESWASTTYVVVSDHQAECEGSCTWDLSEEFDLQASYFSMISTISSINSHSPFEAWAHTMTPEKRLELEKGLLMTQVSELKMDVSRCIGAIEQIAQKMQNAGQSLIF